MLEADRRLQWTGMKFEKKIVKRMQSKHFFISLVKKFKSMLEADRKLQWTGNKFGKMVKGMQSKKSFIPEEFKYI